MMRKQFPEGVSSLVSGRFGPSEVRIDYMPWDKVADLIDSGAYSEVGLRWIKAQEENPKLVDQQLQTVDFWQLSRLGLKIATVDTSLRHYLGSNSAEFASKYGLRRTASPLQVEVAAITADQKIMLIDHGENLRLPNDFLRKGEFNPRTAAVLAASSNSTLNHREAYAGQALNLGLLYDFSKWAYVLPYVLQLQISSAELQKRRQGTKRMTFVELQTDGLKTLGFTATLARDYVNYASIPNREHISAVSFNALYS